MSDLNPYAKYLDGRPIETILADTPGRLAALLETIGPQRAAVAPAPGKWSSAQILCHLADCEIAFGFRLRQTLAEPGHVIQPFDQEKWAENYGGISATQALQTFASLRTWNLQLIVSALPSRADVTVTHPERGTMRFADIVGTIAGHDLNHLGQLQRIAQPAS